MVNTHQSISQMCFKLGQDHLLVQGAGGNVSWKEGDTLWIKGSGKWLADALDEDIFVPVDLKNLKGALSNNFFDIEPNIIGKHSLKPSVETILHALMPQKIVVHLHAINVLSYLVIQDCQKLVNAICQQHNISAIYLDYHKPGSELARELYGSLQKSPTPNFILLQNHGVVIGATTIKEFYALLKLINNAFISQTFFNRPSLSPHLVPSSFNYTPFDDWEVQALALEPALFKRLQEDWRLFPDHVVFLGAHPNVYSSWGQFEQLARNHPELIFIENNGVYVKPEFNKTKSIQLRCYFDVISRVRPGTKLKSLNESEVNALLQWDAEKIRQQMSKS